MHICVIGGGVIGLFNAYELIKAGHRVTLIDRGDFTQGTSYGNAGMICPSHFIPLSAPGIIRQSIKWMMDSSSPFYIQPRWDLEFIQWCFQFCRHANRQHVQKNIGALLALLSWSRDIFRSSELAGLDMGLQSKGIIMACNTAHALQDEIKVSEKANALGIRTAILSIEDLKKLNPGVTIHALGGVHYLDDMHLDPQSLMRSLINTLRLSDILWQPSTEIIDFYTREGRITHAVSAHQSNEAEVFILAGGAWTGSLSKKLGQSLLLQGGKGYNITIPLANPQLTTPMILVEGRVAVTPMGSSLRLGGTMELAGFNDHIRANRVQGIFKTIESYLPDYKKSDLEKIEPWYGFRPLTPTGLPIINRIPNYSNGFINTGHGMLGLSLAPASAKLITQMISKI